MSVPQVDTARARAVGIATAQAQLDAASKLLHANSDIPGFRQAMRICQSLVNHPDREIAAEANAIYAIIAAMLRQSNAALPAAQRALESTARPSTQCYAWLGRALASVNLGLIDDGLRAAEHALRHAKDAQSQWAQLRALSAVAWYGLTVRDDALALAALDHCFQLAVDAGSERDIGNCLINKAAVRTKQAEDAARDGDTTRLALAVRRAQPVLNALFAHAERFDDTIELGYACMNLAQLQLAMGDIDETLRLTERYEQLAEQAGNPRLAMFGNLCRARIALQNRDYRGATRLLKRKAHQATLSEHADLGHRTDEMLYTAHKALKQNRAALAHLERCRDYEQLCSQTRGRHRNSPLIQALMASRAGSDEPSSRAAAGEAHAPSSIEQIRQRAERLERLAMEDELTGMGNRRAFSAYCARVELALTSTDRSLAVVDIDHFKSINDRLGHAVGDQVLRKIAALITGNLRGEDQAFRYGGDEFVIAFANAALEDARVACERLAARLERSAWPDNIRNNLANASVSVSIGIAQLAPGARVEDCLERADRALYEAKRSGRNAIVSDTDD